MRAFNHIFSLILITIFCSISAFAQGQGAPESMNYQAVIRDGSGNVVASQAVSLRIKILQGSASGSTVYVETFAPTTNSYGSIAIQIGTGTVITGTFNTIDWGASSYFVETAVDISGFSNYTVISTTQLMSVPYAMYAKTAGSSPADNDWTESGSNIYRNSGNVGIGNNSPSAKLDVSGTVRVSSLSDLPTFMTNNSDFQSPNASPGDVLYVYLNDVYITHFTTNSGALVNSSNDFGYSGNGPRIGPWGAGVIKYYAGTLSALTSINDANYANWVGAGSQYIFDTRSTANGGETFDGVGNFSWTDWTSKNLKVSLSPPPSGYKMVVVNADGDLSTQAIGTGPAGADGATGPIGPAGSDATNYWIETGSNVYRSSGNVGIGTTSPIKPLSVEFNDGISSGEHILANFSRTTPNSNVGGLYFGYFADGTDETGGILRSTGNKPLYVGTFSSKQLLTLNGLNVGINNISPAYNLDVNGDINLTGSLRVNGVAQTFGGSSSPWTESGTDIYRSSGNVGIGTTTPTSLLQISDGNSQGPTFKIDGLSPSILLQDNSGVSNTVDNFEIRNNLGSLNFSYGDNSDANDDGFLSNTALTISSSGNVVIGNEYASITNGLWDKTNSQLVLGGTHNNAFNSGTKAKLVISGYDNDGSTIYPIYLEDENGNKDHYIKNAPSQAGSPTAYYRGNVGIGTETPNAKLEVSGTTRITDLAGSGDRMVVADADGDLSTQAIPSGGSSMPNGSNNGDMMYWDGSAWQTIAVGSAGAVLQIIGGVPTWVSTPDITGPTITLNGNANMNVVVGGTFTDPGATADEGTLTTSGTVDVTTAGTYTITYTSTDATGNTATMTRTVAVYQSQYNYTGSAQTFTVPAGVTSISVDAYGASGSTASTSPNYGGNSNIGKGGRVQTNLNVTPGDVLNIYVGGTFHMTGYYSYAGGWNGGGHGSKNSCSGVGYSGGGATDIRIGGTALTDRVIVAGGGGGRGYGGNQGGHGGGLVGQNGSGSTNSSGPEYGRGGSQSAGGLGGYFWYGDGTPTYSIPSATNGSLGSGGSAYSYCYSSGGGGGYYGGGAGDEAGGGGGSSYTHPTLCSSVVHTQGVQTGSGQLTITIP